MSANDFAVKVLGREPVATDFAEGAKMLGGKCVGCWKAVTNDGVVVTYRPAGMAGGDTAPTTATVEVNYKKSSMKEMNSGKALKLKFPKGLQ